MPTEIGLPELGENLEGGDVYRVLVTPGETIQKGQPLLELETDKATLEVPSPAAGTVAQVHVQEGMRLLVGDPVVSLTEAAAGGDEPASPEPETGPVAGTEEEPAAAKATAAGAPTPAVPASPAPTPRPGPTATAPSARPVRASPSVRKLAREIGVDLQELHRDGGETAVTAEQVKAHARGRMTGATPGVRGGEPLPDLSRWGPVERRPMSSVRRTTARHLAAAWASVAQVTHHDVADITELEALRQQEAPAVEEGGGKLTLTVLLLKVVAGALRRFPQFNVSVDMAAEEIVQKQYCHVGVAVDTEHGLLVPVLRDVDQKSIRQLAVELTEVSRRARERQVKLEELQGGCFTITNLGGIGGTGFTPIVNTPEVAILGVVRARMEPVWREGSTSFEPRLRLPLSLTYDHRVVDGADAARFMRWVCQVLEQPMRLVLEG